MLCVVRVIRDAGLDPVLESGDSACHNGVKEECDGPLCHRLVAVNA